ncbi:MAG TPA: pyruvate, phosphate dikinase/phosphoenolpyruvate synthase regulator [Acidimicrobiia bacterium]
MTQPVFCVSDHTGLTAEGLAHSVMVRFEGVTPRYIVKPFVTTTEQAAEIAAEIDAMAEEGRRPIVFTTIVDVETRRVLDESKGFVVGVYDEVVAQVGEALAMEPGRRVGGYHGIRDMHEYQVRLDAVDFTLSTDDGVGLARYPSADVIVLGVSRVGKTPTCLYLSMNFGIRAANYPLTQEDLGDLVLPPALRGHEDRLFGLTIEPKRLSEIRKRRRPNSPYATLDTCTEELAAADRIFSRHDIPVLDTTSQSVEEIAVNIIRARELQRRL